MPKPDKKKTENAFAHSTIICFKCKTQFGLTDMACPECGCQTVQVIPHSDPRQPFAQDNRQNGPI